MAEDREPENLALAIERDADGSMISMEAELPGVIAEWLFHQGVTETRLGSVKGYLMEFLRPFDLRFVFFEDRRSVMMSFEEAVR